MEFFNKMLKKKEGDGLKDSLLSNDKLKWCFSSKQCGCMGVYEEEKRDYLKG
jgi:hypothetical protein